MDEILKILAETDWNKIAIEVNDNNNIIKDNFKHEQEFVNYLKHNLSKYDVSLVSHQIIKNEAGQTILLFRFAYTSNTKILSTRYITELADDIMLELSPEEVDDIKKTENSIREKFLKVLTIPTDKVEPLFYPSDEIHTYLREDSDFHVADQKEVLANAPTTDGDYITLVKVIK